MHPAIIIGTVRSLWTWLWGRYHVPQNVFLVIFIAVFLLLAEGGGGKQGRVLSVEDAKNDSSHRSWVKIKWNEGETNKYRRGYYGSVDIKCVKATGGENYYINHLPKLGESERLCVIPLSD